MWLICKILSVLSIAAAIALPIGFNKWKSLEKRKISLFKTMFAGVIAASIFMFFPVHFFSEAANIGGIVRALFLCVFNTIQLFAAGCEFNVVQEHLSACPNYLKLCYQIWATVLFVAAPAFTVGFVLSLFKNIIARLKYRFSASRDVYAFSELNEKSIVLARDISKNHPDAIIVFNHFHEDRQEGLEELVFEAKKLGAICFEKEIIHVPFGKHSPDSSISFFIIGADETQNVNDALLLIERYRERANTNIYVFSTKVEGEIFLSTVDKGAVKVRRINEVRSLVNRILYDQGIALFENAIAGEDGLKHISAVVVGMGNHGTEMVKALSWYCQMNGYTVQINAFDRDPLAEDRFVALAPELMSPDYNGKQIPGEAQYKITVHSGVDVETATFKNKIEQITGATYVFIALGNDDVNVKTAVNMRMYFERMKIKPVIQAVVYNSRQKAALTGLKNFKNQPYDIEFIGDIDASYTESVIVGSELEKDALSRHMKYGPEDTFWAFEYNYRSSIASAIHMKARKLLDIPGAKKKTEELTETEKLTIEDLEHRRWNAYMRSEGYVYSGSKDPESRNDLGKMHHDLIDYASLSEEDKRKDSNVGTE